MRPFSLLIKPASADCNLHCAYCFYLDRAELYPETRVHRMSDATLDRVISSYMATQQPQYSFGWQGGEPTLMGVEFFRRVVELQQKHGRNGARVGNGLQTNALLMDDELAAHLAAYRFLVGVSLDGPRDLHDRFRTSIAERGSHDAVLRGIERLRRHGVEFNALTLVSSANVGHANEVYHCLCDQGIFFHQYIPCVEFDDEGSLQAFAITGAEWGDFLCEVFDVWYSADAWRVSVRLFDSILAAMVDGVKNVCTMEDNCCSYFLVEHNGDVYPCDFFVEPEWKLGNVTENSWEQLLASPAYLRFGRQKAQRNQRCKQCEHLQYCAGDCLKHRLFKGGNPATLSRLCEGWRRFYDHALPRLESLAAIIRSERLDAELAKAHEARVCLLDKDDLS